MTELSQTLNAPLAVIGGGNMGEAMLTGLVAQGAEPKSLHVVEPLSARRDTLANAHGVTAWASVQHLPTECNTLLLAVKPQVVQAIFTGGSVHDGWVGDRLLISLVAGLTTARLASLAGPRARIVRAMPNTPALVRRGVTVLCAGPNTSASDLVLAEALFDAVGRAVRVGDEGLLDAVTGLSGAGPAFVFTMIEALADGGVRAGLPRELALTLARETVRGAGALAIESDLHPGELKDRVTSPAGTTADGLAVLERHAVRGAFADAVIAAAERSRQLGRATEEDER